MFKKAVKQESKLRLAIAGPSGSGKTYSALAIGTALGSKVAFVDTEHGSASKYADIFNFDVVEMHAPYTPAKYISTIEAAANSGYDVLILDSLSHAWNGSGGMLEMVEQVSKKYRGNSYAAWGEVTPLYQRMIENIVSAPLHIIGTMRSKQDYILVEKNGKQTPQKVGMAPIQRDGFEYEFDVFFDMDVENNAIVQKTRCPQLTGQVIAKPGAQVASILREWLQGSPAPAQQKRQAPMFDDDMEEAATDAIGDIDAEISQDELVRNVEIINKTADLRAALETVDNPTIGLVCDYAHQINDYFNAPQHAMNALNSWDGMNGKKPKMTQKLTNETAVKMFDWLIDYKSEA